MAKLKNAERQRERARERGLVVKRSKWNVPRKLRLMKVHALHARIVVAAIVVVVVVAAYWQK